VAWPSYEQVGAELERRGLTLLPSALAHWTAVFRRAAADAAGREFSSTAFPRCLEQYRAALEGRVGQSSVGAYCTRMRRVQEVAAEMAVTLTHGTTFGEVLNIACRARGVSSREVGRVLGVGHFTVIKWRSKTVLPTRDRTLMAVPKAEQLLGLPPGTLTRLLPPRPQYSRGARRPPRTAFAQLLEERLQTLRMSRTQLAAAIGITQWRVQNWLARQTHPTQPTDTPLVAKLAVALGLEEAEIRAALDAARPKRIHQPYTARLTPAQQREWRKLVAHKTRKDVADPARRPRAYWKVNRNGACPAAERTLLDLQSFYGWLSLPPASEDADLDAGTPAGADGAASPHSGVSGMSGVVGGLGLPAGTASLLDLADPEKVEAFVRWRAARSRYNGFTDTFLGTVMSWLRPHTGWLWQAHDLDLGRVDVQTLRITDEERRLPRLEAWRRHCAQAHALLDGWLRHLRTTGQIERGHEYAHIRAILDLPRPMDALRLLMERMRKDFDLAQGRLGPVRRAVARRDLLLVSWLCFNPLRASHWQGMLLPARRGTVRPVGADREGHLRKRADGRYVLFYHKDEFKALADFRDDDYEAEVPEEITALLETYLAVDRQLLAGADTCDYVFRAEPRRAGQDANKRYDMGDVIERLTRRYLPELLPGAGFRTHGFRHIIATHLVKNYDDGITRAADALHNTEQMIRRHYGHLRGRDRSRRARAIISKELGFGRGAAAPAPASAPAASITRAD
jgi:DNA-binding transcriptional regulator YiaG